MSVKTSEHSLYVIGVMDFYPPSIQESIISDSSFKSEHGLTTDSLVSFSDSTVSFRRSQLLRVVRQGLHRDEDNCSVVDQDGNKWDLTVEENDGNTCIRLSKETQAFLLDTFWPLISDVDERLAKFEGESQRVKLPSDRRDHWRQVLMLDAASDDEMVELQADLAETPTSVSELLRREMSIGKSTMSSLIPQTIRYYERLVGRYVGSHNIVEYVRDEVDTFFQELFSDSHYSGLISALLLASHSSISHTLEAMEYDEVELERFYDWLVTDGDLVSRVGAIEMGLPLLDKYSFLEKKIETLAKQLLDDDSEKTYKLLSALITLVDGEIARLQIFSDKPPFYRRLASIAQASLIARCIDDANIGVDSFIKWAIDQRAMTFYCQTVIDLRVEPRWHPDYLTHEQLRAELLGRVIGAFHTNSSSLKNLLWNENNKNYWEELGLCVFLPGPLEGNITSSEIPPEIAEIVKEGLTSGASTPESFIALVNSAQYWNLDSSYSELALKVLGDAKHQLNETGNPDKILFTLIGLARVAAVTKNTNLAAELCILSRRYRSYLDVNSQPEQFLGIGLVSAAAYDDLEGWAIYIGEWITELAYLPLSASSVKKMHNFVKQLCLLEPALYCTCGRALTTLESLAA